MGYEYVRIPLKYVQCIVFSELRLARVSARVMVCTRNGMLCDIFSASLKWSYTTRARNIWNINHI